MFQWKRLIIFVSDMINKIIYKTKKNWLYLLGGILGGVAGYMYWFYIGCESGTCPITSSPILSIIWGTMIGALFLGMFKKGKK